MTKFLTTKDAIAYVDDEDFHRLNKFRWKSERNGQTTYFYFIRKLKSGRLLRVYLHWVVLSGQIPKGMEIDHIDGDGLNNQKYNLRIVTHKENCNNRHKTVLADGEEDARIAYLKKKDEYDKLSNCTNEDLEVFIRDKETRELVPADNTEIDTDSKRIADLMRKDGKTEEEIKDYLKGE